jgi:hypothetical protein
MIHYNPEYASQSASISVNFRHLQALAGIILETRPLYPLLK